MSIKKLAGETAIYGISSLVGRLLYFLLTPFYTNIFLPSEYGIVTDLFAYIGFAMVLFTYRMELAYFRFGSEDGNSAKKTFDTSLTSIISSTLLLGSLFLFISPWMSSVSGYGDRNYLTQMAVLILCLDAINEIPFARLRLEGRAWKFALVRLTNIAINLGLNLFFLFLCPFILKNPDWASYHSFIASVYNPDFGIGYIFLSNVVASASTSLLLLPYFLKFRFRIDWAHWKKMMRYAAPMIIVGFSYVINEMFDRKMMIHLLGGSLEENQHQLGIYGANYKLAMILALFTQAFRYGVEPFFFKQKKQRGAQKMYATIANYFTIFGVLGFLGVTLYIDIFKYFIGPNYWVGLKVVPILLLANLFLGLYYNFSAWYKLTDRTKYGAYISLFGAFITIVLNLILLPIWGYMGAAWTTLICYFVMTAISWYFGRKYYPIPYPIKRMLTYVLLALSIYYFHSMLPLEAWSTWIKLILSTGLLLFFFSIVILLEKKELKQIWLDNS